MKNKTNYILTFLFLSLSLCAQNTIKYQVFNGAYVNRYFAPMINTQDGGYYLHCAYGDSPLNINNTLIIKTDSNFMPLWRKKFASFLNNKRVLTFLDGTSLLFGRAGCQTNQLPNGQSNWFCPQFKLQKFSDLGETVWTKTISTTNGSISPFDTFMKDINAIKIGGKIGGPTLYNPVIMNFDLDGNFIQGSYINGLNGTIYSMCKEENTGNYYALISDYICKFNQDDSLLWIKKINSPIYFYYDDTTVNADIKVLNNGDIVLSFNDYNSVLVLRISSDGNIIWSKRVDNSSGIVFGGIKELNSGEMILSYTAANRNYVIKISSTGNYIWSKDYKSSSSTSELYEKNSNEWYFATFGYNLNAINHHQPSIFSTDNSGSSTCIGVDVNKTITEGNITLTVPLIMANQIIISSVQTTTDGPSQLFSLENQTATTDCGFLNNNDFQINNLLIYPNPNSGNFTVKSNVIIEKVEVLTLLGQYIYEINPNLMDFSVSLKETGIYLVKLHTIFGAKMVKVVVTK